VADHGISLGRIDGLVLMIRPSGPRTLKRPTNHADCRLPVDRADSAELDAYAFFPLLQCPDNHETKSISLASCAAWPYLSTVSAPELDT